MEADVRLSVERLTVGYHGKAVLSEICFSVHKGELFTLVGPNGSGKTTLLKALAGLTQPISGTILLDSKPITSYLSYERASKIGYVAQASSIHWPFTVYELVSQGRFPSRGWFGNERQEDRIAVEEALEITDLSGYRERLVTELSGGELQRVLIARSLAQKPELLILDEPISHLDIRYQITTMELLQKLISQGLSAVISLHDLNLASLYASTMSLVAKGCIVKHGTVQEVLRPEILQEAYTIDVEVTPHPEHPNLPMIYYHRQR
ncbi:ABC transporter ATP-binding protein [Gracilinema caldarium]|uniref:Iron-chelate-transporting ATPase n=1 Tax=Gracilinema caldarium (strain ATCC 51460 / DSM 7334 / H1) TaxID=744872 RepID=F8F0L0_GRAC1|nr:ABC transporter ATP-binding protein [Gracilinema caldarium]AEJ19354.1 Iron-chelate-transporting ATPase [Gracilinema caldarium DSM 7334]